MCLDLGNSPYARWRTLPPGSVSLTGGLWAQRQSVNRETSLRHGYRTLRQVGNFYNLRLAAGLTEGKYRGPMFMDSDLYKWLEAMAWELAHGPDDELQHMIDLTIELIVAAQADDGYLDSYFQVVEPDNRWSNLKDGHELYCAGHLIQAAVAHRRVVGDSRLLHVACRFADYVGSVFGPDKRSGTPGHPELEMALVELYRETGEERYLDLARFFLDQRGQGLVGAGRYANPAYYQDHVPVRLATAVAGHAVRQLYLVAGVTDVFLETGERALLDAVLRQWQDMTEGKLAITGGVGARHEGEAFGEPYELPNDRCYNETCAAIASIFWNWRLLLATGEARFADLIERTLYGGFLSGVSLDGQRFFYVNPLLSRGGIERAAWYTCACCPPNVMRVLASLDHYFVTSDSTDGARGRAAGVQIHQYAPCVIAAELGPGRQVILAVETDYPWHGQVMLTIRQTDGQPWRLALRVPGWCDDAAMRVEGQPVEVPSGGGYAAIERTWCAGDTIELEFPMTPQLVEPHPQIDAARGCVAIRRGPVVYCIEQIDQEPSVDVLGVQIDGTLPLRTAWRGDLLGGVMTVEAKGYTIDADAWGNQLYRPAEDRGNLSREPVRLTAVPYYGWANREPGPMRVWIPRAR